MICKNIGGEIYIVCQKSSQEASEEINNVIRKIFKSEIKNGTLPKISQFEGKEEFEKRCPEKLKKIVYKYGGNLNKVNRRNSNGLRHRCLSRDSISDQRLEDMQDALKPIHKPLPNTTKDAIKNYSCMVNKEEVEEQYKNINSRIKSKIRDEKIYRR